MAKIITKIEVLDSKEDFVRLFREGDFATTPFDSDMAIQMVEMEYVQGRRFRRGGGQEVVIGWCKELADLLDLPLEAYDNMDNTIEGLRLDKADLQVELRRLKTSVKESLKELSLWQLIKLNLKDWLQSGG